MCANEWLYVFGFATHILSFKAQRPIGKTDIYNGRYKHSAYHRT